MKTRGLFGTALILLASWFGCRTRPTETGVSEKGVSARAVPQQILTEASSESKLSEDTARVSEATRRLYRAVWDNDIELIRPLIAGGAEVNVRDDTHGGMPLHLAAEAGHKDAVKLLLANGADVNAEDAGGATPLHEATCSGRKGVAEVLLMHGADVTRKDARGSTPLHSAIVGDYFQVVTETLDAKYHDVSIDDERYLELETELADKLMIDMVRLLLANGADVSARDEIDATPLQYAFDFAPLAVLELLVAEGADVDVRNRWGGTLLHEAASCGTVEDAAFLVANGADVNARNRNGETALHEAVWENRRSMAEFLISKRAEIDAKDGNGNTPLHVAALNGHKELHDLLVASGADVAATNRRGQTPTDCAHAPVRREMVTLHADGKSPYSVIVTEMRAVRRFLRSHEIDFNDVWIPERDDIERLDLEAAIEQGTRSDARSWFLRDYLLENLRQYNREYSGFMRGGAKYIVCNMSPDELKGTPPENRFTEALDGGCGFVRLVYDVEEQAVVRIDCNGS